MTMTEYTKQPVLDRFLSFVDKSEDCWLWKGHRLPNRYGTFQLRRKAHRAHRVSYTLFVGEIPENLHVLHRCDNPSCVNPSHLFLGTHQDNMADKGRKGRNVIPKGIYNGNAKLNDDAVRDIRKRYRRGNGCALARQYGVSSTIIYSALKGTTWRHV